MTVRTGVGREPFFAAVSQDGPERNCVALQLFVGREVETKNATSLDTCAPGPAGAASINSGASTTEQCEAYAARAFVTLALMIWVVALATVFLRLRLSLAPFRDAVDFFQVLG